MTPFSYLTGALGIALLLALAGDWWLFNAWTDARVSAQAFEQRVAQIGKDATIAAAAQKAAQDKTTKEIQDALPIAIKAAQDAAVAAYKRRYGGVCVRLRPDSSSESGLSAPTVSSIGVLPTSGKRVDVGCSTEFVRACATDAEVRRTMRLWLIKQGIPISP